MNKKTKAERRAEAVTAEIQRTADRLYALSAAFLRAETAYEKFRDEWGPMRSTGKTDDELVAELAERVSRLENVPLTRAAGLMMVYLGLLYAVVEAWRKWDLDHEAVDDLLRSPFLKELKDYRDVVFHVNVMTDRRLMQFTAQKDRAEWVGAVFANLRLALLDWHKDLERRATIRLGRRPV